MAEIIAPDSAVLMPPANSAPQRPPLPSRGIRTSSTSMTFSHSTNPE
jgi:hypothetical protein